MMPAPFSQPALSSIVPAALHPQAARYFLSPFIP